MEVPIPIPDRRRTSHLRAAAFAVGAVAFAMAYGLKPLYLENQNTYLLHGLASSGFGFLSKDWLANTTDPTPVFSFAVRETYILLGEWAFHLWYVLLLGIYFCSMLAICREMKGRAQDDMHTVVMGIGIVVLHSNALRAVWSRLMPMPNIPLLLQSGIAGQYVLGPVFQPSLFGVFILLGIALFLSGKHYQAIAAVSCAVLFHPTYVFVSATVVLAFAICSYANGVLRSLTLCALFAALVSPILFYALINFEFSSEETIRAAQHILVYERIPHHALLRQWATAGTWLQLAAIIGGIWVAARVARHRKLFLILLIPFLVALAGTAVQAVSGSQFLALLFPWRVSVLLVPMSTCLILSALVPFICRWLSGANPALYRKLRAGAVVAVGAVALLGLSGTLLSFHKHQNDPAQKLFQWVRTHKRPGDCYLVPVPDSRRSAAIVTMEFRLATGVPVFVDWKSHPYKDVEVLEWHKRIQFARGLSNATGLAKEEALREARAKGISYVVLPASEYEGMGINLPLEYNDGHYAVLALASGGCKPKAAAGLEAPPSI